MNSVLITRPLADARQLQQMLASAQIPSVIQPLFTLAAGLQLDQLPALVHQADIVIAVSKHAVMYASQALAAPWPDKRYLAVGQATQTLLQQVSHQAVVAPQQQTSEGLLQLTALHQVNSANILILRGQSGRELLAEHLRDRGAKVRYCECYRRQVMPLDGQACIASWQQAKVHYLVITSSEQLDLLQQLCPNSELSWLHQQHLITVSHRIALHARTLGFETITISNEASNQSLFQSLNELYTAGNPL